MFENNDLIEDWMIGKTNAETTLNKIVKNQQELATTLKELHISVKLMQMETEVINIIQSHKNNFDKIVLSTDNMDVFTLFEIPNKLFDDILSSANIGALKRTPNLFFGEYLQKHNYKPSQCL